MKQKSVRKTCSSCGRFVAFKDTTIKLNLEGKWKALCPICDAVVDFTREFEALEHKPDKVRGTFDE